MSVAILKTLNPRDVSRVLDRLGGLRRFVSRGDRVLVKPNICAPRSSASGAVTDPELVAELCRLVEECGGKPMVADSPIFPFPARAAFRIAGYADFPKKYGFPLLDLDSEKDVTVRVPDGEILKNQIVSKRALEADVLINVPVMKNHVHTTVTLSLKNLKGLVPRRNKHVIHLKGLDQGIVDLNTLFKSSLIVMDAIVGMEGMLSPVNGRAKRMNLLLAGDNVVETDAAACRIMGIDPRKVPHIVLAERRELGRIDGSRVLGESIEAVRSRFRFYDRHRTLTSGATRLAWSFWSWGYNELARRVGSDILRPLEPRGEWSWDGDKCNGCKLCIEGCPAKVLSLEKDRILRDRKNCIYCYCCVEVCPQGAISRM